PLCAAGDGGTINIASGAGITVSTPAMSFGPTGTNGAGGKLTLLAKTGNLTVNGDLNANANGAGAGGQISLSSTNGFVQVAGNLAANGSVTGNGGTINITSNQASPYVMLSHGTPIPSGNGGIAGTV